MAYTFPTPSRKARSLLGPLVAVLVVLVLTAPPAELVLPQIEDTGTGGGSEGPKDSRSAPDPEEWPTFKGDDQRTGVSASRAPSVDKVLWSVNYEGAVIYSSPTVWNGTIYIGVSGSIKAIWAKNGTERWSYSAPNPVHTSPVIADGVIYAGANDYAGNSVFAVDALTGQEVWRSPIPDFVTSTPLVLGTNVYAGCEDSKLYCMQRSDGVEKWNFTASGPIRYGALAYGDGKVVFGTMSNDTEHGRVYAVDATTGDEAWNKTIVGSVWSAPCISDGYAIVSTAADNSIGAELRNGYVYSFNLTSGSQRWRTRNVGMVFASPSASGGRIYVGTFGKIVPPDIRLIEPMMYCLDELDGGIIWNDTVNHRGENAKVWSSVTVAGSLVVFGDELGYLNVWNKNGIRVWNHEMRAGAAVKTSPAVAGEMVFVANTMGDVYGFGAQPDLSVNSTVIELGDQLPHLGQRIEVRAKISNVGDKTATGTVYLYNGSLDDWHTVINSTIVTLEAGRSTHVHAVWTADEVGNRAVWVRILDVVPNEETTENNEAARVVEVLPPSEGWLMARSDEGGDGFMPTERPTNNVTKWLRAEGSAPGPGLAATNGSVLFPVGDRVISVERLSGDVEWSRVLGSTVTTPVAVGDGAVVLGTADGWLHCLDLEEGFTRFALDLDGQVTGGPVVFGSTVVVGMTMPSDTGALLAFDTFDGTELWDRQLDKPVSAHPSHAGGVVYSVYDEGGVMALNATDGNLLWQYPVGNPAGQRLTATPAVSGGRLFVGSTSGFMYCLDADPSDGQDEGFSDPEGSSYDVLWKYRQEEDLPFNRSPVLLDGLMATIVGDDRVIALHSPNGSIAWSRSVGDLAPLTMGLMGVEGGLVVGGAGLAILSTDTGDELWAYRGSNLRMVGGGAAVDGMLFATDIRGILYAFGKVENMPPVARVTAPVADQTFRINESVNFDASDTSDDKELPDSSFVWDFGDGNYSLSRITSHRYITAGTYKVLLTVTDTDGEADNTSVTIKVMENHAPSLGFYDVTPDQGYELGEHTFRFSVMYTDPDNDEPTFITMRLMNEPGVQPYTMIPEDPADEDFRDGKIYYFEVPLTSRPYDNVTFRASDGIAVAELVRSGPTVLTRRTFYNSVGDIEVRVEYVGPSSVVFEPVTSPPVTPTSLHSIGVYVQLNLTTRYLKNASISINYTFHDFEEIDLATLAIYRWAKSDQDAGWEYLPSSQVDNTTGLVTATIPSLQDDIYTVLGNMLNPPTNTPPVAVMNVSGKRYVHNDNVETTFKPDEIIRFDASASYDPDNSTLSDYIVEYLWSFGDGEVSRGKTAEHRYERGGKYPVKLTVRDRFDETHEVTVFINVREEQESALIVYAAIIGIIVLLILLFYPKGSQQKAAPPKEPEVPSDEGTSESEGEKGDVAAKRDALDDIIDELEEDRG